MSNDKVKITKSKLDTLGSLVRTKMGSDAPTEITLAEVPTIISDLGVGSMVYPNTPGIYDSEGTPLAPWSKAFSESYFRESNGKISATNKCNSKKIVMGPNATNWADYTFDAGNKVLEVIPPEGMVTIPSNAFLQCYSVSIPSIPSTVKTIKSRAFYSCGNKASIVLPNGLETIEERAFYNCYNTPSITIPNTVTSIGMYAFDSCVNAVINIPTSITEIGSQTYCNTGITTITIPGNVKSIGYLSFGRNSKLQTVTIENGLESIGVDAFYQCGELTTVIIPNSVTSINENAFAYCSKLTTIYYSGTATGAPWGAPNATVVAQ